MKRAIIQRARTLIRTECANYFNGGCAPADRQCMQLEEFKKPDGEKIKLCQWFRDGVLPRDPALQEELTAKGNNSKVQLCAGCGQPILLTSNRQRFCAVCAKRNENRGVARRMRNYRAK